MTQPSKLEQLAEKLAPAIDNLRNYQEQADMHGERVKVSRQALDEVLDGLDAALRAAGEVVHPSTVNPFLWDHPPLAKLEDRNDG